MVGSLGRQIGKNYYFPYIWRWEGQSWEHLHRSWALHLWSWGWGWEAVLEPGAWPALPKLLASPFSSSPACNARDGLSRTGLGHAVTQGCIQVPTQHFPVQPSASPPQGIQLPVDLVWIVLPSSLSHHMKLVSSRLRVRRYSGADGSACAFLDRGLTFLLAIQMDVGSLLGFSSGGCYGGG